MWGPIMSGASQSYFGAASFYFAFPAITIDHRKFKRVFEHDGRARKNRLSLTDFVRIVCACVTQRIKEDGRGILMRT